jgi:hypothetical protein
MPSILDDAVIAGVDIERVLLLQYPHQINVFDTLGIDPPETACRF